MNDIDYWDSIVTSLIGQEGSAVTTDPARWDLDNPGYNEIFAIWNKAKFNPGAIRWINYYPDQHYPRSVENKVAKFLNLAHVHRSWISRLDPGFIAPWHCDRDENEKEYSTHGTIIRCTVIIKKFAKGHLFILNDEYHYKQEVGTAIVWPNHLDWHAGINGGLEPNFMLHILGSYSQ
jgi:hypothetical protein